MLVLVTRPERPAARTAARLTAAGHQVLLDPLLELDFDPPPHLLENGQPDGIVLTSANGVHALAGHPDLPGLRLLRLWTVGSRTGAAALKLGFTALQGETPDLATLALMLCAEPSPLHLLHLAGAHRAGDLAALVAPSGHRIDTVVVYRAAKKTGFSEATLSALSAGEINAVLHYSRRTAETYLELAAQAGYPPSGTVLHLCLSDAVAEPLRDAQAQVRVATHPTEDALMACLADESRLAKNEMAR